MCCEECPLRREGIFPAPRGQKILPNPSFEKGGASRLLASPLFQRGDSFQEDWGDFSVFPLARLSRQGERGTEGVRALHRDPGFTPGATQGHPKGCGTKPGNRAGTGACPYRVVRVGAAPCGRPSPSCLPLSQRGDSFRQDWGDFSVFPLARLSRQGERGTEGVRALHRDPGFTPGATQLHPKGCGTKPGNRAGTGACPYRVVRVGAAPCGRPSPSCLPLFQRGDSFQEDWGDFPP
jgi:hypothetical protein